MASLSESSAKGFRVFWLDAEGVRRSISLGRVSRRNAERFLTYFERLLEARRLGLTADPETQRWLDGLDAQLLDRLAKHGLVEAKQRASLKSYLDDWLRIHADYPTGTKDAWSRSIADLLAFFGAEKRITDITPAEAEHYRQWLRDVRKLSDSTIAKRLGHVKRFFTHAVRMKVIAENPFRWVTHRISETKRRWRYVSTEEIERVLAVCPNAHWRLLVVLCRYAGLRCPSEHFSLRWSHIHFDEGYFVIEAPKTGLRRCPLFAPVRKALQEVWDVESANGELPGDSYIFPESWRKRAMTPRGFRNANLRIPFTKILKRAGIEPWPDIFHALRKSCETDLVQQFPLPNVAKWLGNSNIIAYRHYIDITETSLRDAAERAWAIIPGGPEEREG